ncbi:VOC family protein [Gallibacterium genomosp. 3]|uniref:Metal-binding protein n=1 Tax=Gallibacterium genomosp. 3 TaxID=505345 RepID=A0A1A7QAI6_9PAST|nr:VOC family protein [Gallibacterium genomosp. 3]OBX11141.1 hypothetical protein QV07_01995 [Gallibacterium genomosp. 3]
MTNLKIFQQYPTLANQLITTETLFKQLIEVLGTIVQSLTIDHIALRVNTLVTAQQWQQCLASDATLLSDNLINGRPIYLYELNQPLTVLGQPVSVVELPFPTEKQYPQEGWEHIEMVFPFVKDETVEQWFERVEQLLKNVRERIILKKNCHKADGEGLPNPAVAIKLVENNHFVTIKLHPYSIKQIVMSEK